MGLPLVGVEGGKLRGEVAREVQGFGVAAREADDGVQLLLLTRYAKQTHGCRVLPGIGAEVIFANCNSTFVGVA